jgi:hypothetical protein
MNSNILTNPVPGDLYYRHSSAPTADPTLILRVLVDQWVYLLDLGNTSEEIRDLDLYESCFPTSETALELALKWAE